MKTIFHMHASGKLFYTGLLILMIAIFLFIANFNSIFRFNLATVFFVLLAIYLIVCAGIWIHFHHINFLITEKGVTLKKGFLSTSIVYIPYSKIQNIKATFPVIERIFGLGRIMVDTAGTNKFEIDEHYIPKKYIDKFMLIYSNYKKKE